MKIVLASSNVHKVKEINEIINLHPLLEERDGVRCQDKTSPAIEFILPPDGFDPVEDGTTFEENSLIKARAAWELTKTWAMADDSGLCIKALGGNPGIYSARYADTPQSRIDRVLSELEGIENRDACFKCAMTLINPDGEIALAATGVCKGSIVKEQRGTHGFGYDPIFLVQGTNKTMAELTDNEKNQISHRARALNEVLRYIFALKTRL